MSDQLHILLLEDQPNDAELVMRELRRAGFQFDWQRVDTEADYLSHLDPALDLILADYTVPQFTALRALQLLLERNLDIPFIVVTGTISEEVAIECMRLGAADYLLKDRLARLGQAVTRALERKQQRLARQQAEAALRETEERFRVIFEHANDAIHIANANNEIIQVNPRLCELMGYSREELLKMQVADLQAPEVRQTGNVVEGELERHGNALFEGLNLHRSGRRIPVEISVARVPRPQGDWYVSIVRDITERKQAEETRRERETYLHAILNNSPFLMWLKDADGRFLAVNEVFARSCGAAGPDEVVGKTDLDVWPRELAERYRADDREVMQHTQRKSVEEPILAQGVITWFETSKTPIRDEAGRVLGTAGFSRDITERKQAEEALRTSKILLEQTIEQSPIPMVLVSMPDAIIRIANPACLSFLGIDDEPSVINIPLTDIKPSWQDFDLQGRPGALEELPLARSLMGIKTEGEERYIVRKDGSIRHELVNGIPIFDDAGRVIAGHLIMVDITDRKQAEEALQRRAAQLVLLNEVGNKIAAVRELQNVLDTTARLIHETFGYHHVALFTTNPERGELMMAAKAGEFVNLFPPDHRLKLGQGLVGWVGLHGEILLANDVHAEPRYVNFYADVLPTQSELTVPLQLAQENVGVLDVQSPQLNAFDENDVLVLKTLADQIAVAIENARLYATVRQELADRTRAEQGLRASEERFRALIENATDMVRVLDPSGVVTYVSPSVQRIMGYAPEVLVGRSAFELIHPEDLARSQEEWQAITQASEPSSKVIEARIRHADGTWHIHETISTNLLNEPSVRGVVINTRDITVRKQHERELEALVTVAAALRAAPTRGDMLPVIVYQAMSLLRAEAAALIMPSPATNDNVFVLARGTWADWTGMHSPIGQGVTDRVLAIGQPIMRGGEPIPGILWPDQLGEIPLVACVPLIVDSRVMAALWVGRHADLTAAELRMLMAIADIAANALHRANIFETLERRVADRTRELSIANEQLKELDRVKDQFVSNVSHELRTPLANLKLYLALLERGKPEKRAEYLQTLHREQHRLDRMIENLLDLSRLDLGVTPIQLVPAELNLLLSQIIADRSALAAEQQLLLDYQPDDDLPLALIDPVILTEVITNLLGNAINYTPAGGVITVLTATREQAGDDWVTFTIQDNGLGISARDLPHLFERFYRGEVGRKANAPGSGLGLAISKELVEKMGGRITVESDGVPGHGAAFRVWLRPTS